jgi:DNA replication and repair protein RecF
VRRRYGQALSQRNALLARVRTGSAPGHSLDAWDRELAVLGTELTAVRAGAGESLGPAFARAAEELGLGREATLRYRPRIEQQDPDDLAAELGRRRESDLARGYTGYGPHLDELELAAAGRALRRYGSQGQQRIALLALLFAERETLLEARRPPPLMLLDDVMSELDPERRRRLGERLRAGGGQALITATEPDQLPAELERLELAVREGRVIAPLDANADRRFEAA